MMDRFDTHIVRIEVPRVEYEKLADERLGEPSSTIQQRVETARRRQQGRFEHLDSVTTNADMGPAELRLYAKLDRDGSALMKNATSQLNLSARAYHRVLKLARTIADLAGADDIGTAHAYAGRGAAVSPAQRLVLCPPFAGASVEGDVTGRHSHEVPGYQHPVQLLVPS